MKLSKKLNDLDMESVSGGRHTPNEAVGIVRSVVDNHSCVVYVDVLQKDVVATYKTGVYPDTKVWVSIDGDNVSVVGLYSDWIRTH